MNSTVNHFGDHFDNMYSNMVAMNDNKAGNDTLRRFAKAMFILGGMHAMQIDKQQIPRLLLGSVADIDFQNINVLGDALELQLQSTLTKPEIQKLVFRNKLMLRNFEETRTEVKRAIKALWVACNPEDNSEEQKNIFSMLNHYKDVLRVYEQMIKEHGEIQRKLKRSLKH